MNRNGSGKCAFLIPRCLSHQSYSSSPGEICCSASTQSLRGMFFPKRSGRHWTISWLLVEFAAAGEEEVVFWATRGTDPELTKRLLAGLDGLAEMRTGMVEARMKMEIREGIVVGRSMVSGRRFEIWEK